VSVDSPQRALFAWRNDPSTDAGVGVAFTGSGLTFGNCDAAVVQRNRDALCHALGLTRMVLVHQVHGTDVLVVDESLADAPAGPLPVADALVTRMPGIGLAVRVADCVPVALADPVAGVIAVAHAGRVGLLAGVLPAAVAAMAGLGADPARMNAWIGPHICGACYEVPEDMARSAQAQLPGITAVTSWGTPSLDLGAAAAAQLATMGVAAVERRDPCTRESPDLFSHRGDGPATGRQIGLVWLVVR